MRRSFAPWRSPTTASSRRRRYAKGAEAICNEPVGSGPWIFTKWTHGQNINFIRNPNYNSWPANALHQGPAYAEKLVWSFVPDPTTRYGSLTTGQSNVIYDVPAPDWDCGAGKLRSAAVHHPGPSGHARPEHEQRPFTDLRVRQAFAYGADRKQAVESAFEGKVPYNGNGSLSQSTPWIDSSLEERLAYNPDKAEQLLDRGRLEGRQRRTAIREKGRQAAEREARLRGRLDHHRRRRDRARGPAAQWKQVGFNVELKPMTLSQSFGGEYSKPTTYDAIASSDWTQPHARGA